MKLIYAIQHNKTRRIYVGCTGTAGRISSHLSSAKNLKHHVPLINEDTEKHGFDFTVYVLEIIQPRYEWEARDAERKWMHYFSTCDPTCGYNYLDKLAEKRSIDSFPIYSEESWRTISAIFSRKDFLAQEEPVEEHNPVEKTEMYERFERLLNERNVTVYRVAKETKISRTTFTHWKQGRYQPKADKLQDIADFFGVPITYFIE